MNQNHFHVVVKGCKIFSFSSFQLNLIKSYIHFAYEPKPFPNSLVIGYYGILHGSKFVLVLFN